MFSAILYLQACSFWNRSVSRLKRLRQPKYLVGAIVGGLYFYFYFFRYLLFPHRHPGAGFPPSFTVEHAVLLELGAALLLAIIVVLAWVIPHERAALAFSEAEVAFLFPAPVSRRSLIHLKLARSQARILFTVVFLDLFSGRLGGNLWFRAVGLWLIMSTLNLHFLGSSFARTLLLERGISNWVRRGLVLGVVLAVVVGVVLWARASLPAMTKADLANPDAVLDYVERVLTSGPALVLLYPFRLLARPVVASDGTAFLRALGPAALIFALHYVWVVYSNVAFEEASVEASRRLASKLAAVRSGNWRGVNQNQKGKRPWFRLAPTGSPATALLWKNLIGIGQAVTGRIWISLMVICIAFYFGFARNAQSKSLFTFLSILIGSLMGWSILVGPQFLRQDFRQDLPQIDILKSYPVRGWQVSLGELLAPVVLLTGFQWLLLCFGTFFLLAAHPPRAGLWLAIAFAALLLMPVIDAVLFLIPNAAVLLFPSWIPTGKDAARGIEATGQRLVFLLGQVLVLALTLIPAALVFAIVFFVIKLALNPVLAIPAGAIAAAVVLGGETALGVMLLGKLFERFDLSTENTP